MKNPYKDDLFKEATWIALGNEAEASLEKAKEERFKPSKELEEKIKREQKRYFLPSVKPRFLGSLTRFAAGFVAGAIIVTILLTTVPAFAQWATKLLKIEGEHFTHYRINTEVENQAVVPDLSINYIPEGFELVEYNMIKGIKAYYNFRNAQSDYFSISIYSHRDNVSVDNENLDVRKEIMINGYPADYISKYGQSNITWAQENLIILVGSSLNEQETIKIATGIKFKTK